MATRRKLPALPSDIFSVLGPIPVTEREMHKDNLLGLAEFRPREISLDDGMSLETSWQVLGHEIMHFVLWDGGVTDVLAREVEEAICNAYGTYFAAAVKAGWVKLSVPKP